MPRDAERSEVTLIGGRPARYRVRRSDRARRITLRVTHDEGLVVVLPRRWALAEVGRALAQHDAWLDRTLERYDVRLGPHRRGLAPGAAIPVAGLLRRLELAPLPPGATRSRFALRDGMLEARLPAAQLLDPRPAVEHWLRGLARETIARRVVELWPAVGVAPRRIIVGERVTRWGSCSEHGSLSFSWRLILAPPPVLDAIVCHELCHLVHFDHGPGFRALLQRVCPDHDTCRAWLRAHANELRF